MAWCIIVIVLVLLSLPPLILLFKKQVLPHEVDRQWKDDFFVRIGKVRIETINNVQKMKSLMATSETTPTTNVGIDFFAKEVEHMMSLVEVIKDEPMRELLGLIIHNCAMSEKEMSDRLEKLEKQAAHLMWGKHFSFD